MDLVLEVFDALLVGRLALRRLANLDQQVGASLLEARMTELPVLGLHAVVLDTKRIALDLAKAVEVELAHERGEVVVLEEQNSGMTSRVKTSASLMTKVVPSSSQHAREGSQVSIKLYVFCEMHGEEVCHIGGTATDDALTRRKTGTVAGAVLRFLTLMGASSR